MKFVNLQFSRVLLGTAFLAIGLYATLPYLINVRSDNAIINTLTMNLSSPVEGFVSIHPAAQDGWVEEGEVLLTISGGRQNRSFLNELLTERRTLAARGEALFFQSQQLNALDQIFDQDLDDNSNETIARLALEIAEIKAEQPGVIDVVDRLRERSALPSIEVATVTVLNDWYEEIIQLEYDQAFRDQVEIRSDILASAFTILRLELDQDILKKGIYVRQGRNDVPYSQQRRDEIAIRLTDILGRATEIEERISGIDAQIEEEEQRLSDENTSEVLSPSSGIILKNYVFDGRSVPPDFELMQIADCRAMFVEAAVPYRYADVVSVGSTAKVRLLGDTFEYDARVSNITGPTSNIDPDLKAARLQDFSNSDLIVRLEFESNDHAFATHEENCFIGRLAIVQFPQPLRFSIDKLTRALKSVF